MSTKPCDPITAKVLDLLGQEVIDKLLRHGLVVADLAAVARFQEEHRRETDRIRETAAAGMRAIGINGVRAEMYEDNSRVSHMIITAPVFDDVAFGQMVMGELKRTWFSAPPPEGMKPSDKPAYETTDIQIATAPPALEGHESHAPEYRKLQVALDRAADYFEAQGHLTQANAHRVKASVFADRVKRHDWLADAAGEYQSLLANDHRLNDSLQRITAEVLIALLALDNALLPTT